MRRPFRTIASHRFSRLAALLLACTAASCGSIPSPSADAGPPGPRYLTRQHDLFERLVGTFEVAGWTQHDPFGVRLDFVGTAEGRLVLDGLCVELAIRGRLGDDDYEALHLLGYDASDEAYQLTTLTSWNPVAVQPASGRFDLDAGELSLTGSGRLAGTADTRELSSVFSFPDDETWTLDRFVGDWEPRRWSQLRASRGIVPVTPDPTPDPTTVEAGAGDGARPR